MDKYEREGAGAFQRDEPRESCRYKKPELVDAWQRGWDGAAAEPGEAAGAGAGSSGNTLEFIHPDLRHLAVPIELLNEDPDNANDHDDASGRARPTRSSA